MRVPPFDYLRSTGFQPLGPARPLDK